MPGAIQSRLSQGSGRVASVGQAKGRALSPGLPILTDVGGCGYYSIHTTVSVPVSISAGRSLR
jgi:hypothetical protein